MDNVKFYEWKGNKKYILDQYGRVYLKSTKQRVELSSIKNCKNYTNSLIGMDRHQAALYGVEVTKQL